MLELRPTVVGVILLLAVASYLTKVGGFWLVGAVSLPDRAERGLAFLPGAVVVAFVAPELARGGPAEWAAGAITVLVAYRTDNLIAALVAGTAAVVLFRGV